MEVQINSQSVSGAFRSMAKQVKFSAAKQSALIGTTSWEAETQRLKAQWLPGSWAENAVSNPSPFAADGSSASGRL